jgi:hypothetical protein
MARPKTVALLREKAIGHGEKALARLAKYAETDDGGDPRMAAVIERACEALLDRIGLTPRNAEVAANAEEAKEPSGNATAIPDDALDAGLSH